MDELLKRRENESDFEYKVRLCKSKLNKEIDLDWSEISEMLKLGVSSDHLRKLSYGYKEYDDYLIQKETEEITDNDILNELEEKKKELELERKKLQSEKVEYNKMFREQARIELYLEKMTDSIQSIQPLKINNKDNNNKDKDNNKEGLLTITDIHFGKEIEIKDFNDNIINKYNEDIFKQRMNCLLWKIVDIIQKEKLNTLNIFNLADNIDGILRFSQLQSLQYGIIDSVILFSEFMSNWLNELSQFVNIEYYSAEGNHDEIRLLKEKGKGDFPNENVNRLIMHFLEIRLKDNKRVNVHNDNKPFIFENIMGVNVFGYHGEDKNLSNTLKDLQIIYNQKIDLLLAGHLHSSSLQTVGLGQLGDIECIRIPSICGIDDYSMKLLRSANAGAKLFIIEENKGKTITYDINLQN